MVKLDLAAHDVTQSCFEGSGAVQTGGRAIREHFLQAGRSMADAAEQEVVDAQELESNIPRHGLARHVAALAQFAQRLPIPRTEAVQQLTPDGIGQRAEHRVHAHEENMQPNGCLSRSTKSNFVRPSTHVPSGRGSG